MFEAIWNMLNWEQQLGAIMLFLLIPIGIVLHIDHCGGWALYWAEHKRRANMKRRARK